jgi:hypothetical protein
MIEGLRPQIPAGKPSDVTMPSDVMLSVAAILGVAKTGSQDERALRFDLTDRDALSSYLSGFVA